MKFKLNTVLFFLIVFSLSIQAQKKDFEIEDLYKIKSVGSPAISNDGTRIAYTVTSLNLKAGKSNTEIYLMNADGSNQKRLTNNDAADFNPIWKADDSGILFLSTRNGSSQLFCLPIDGGEAKQITDFGLGVTSVKLSLDGKSIIFQASVFPECGIDVECNNRININIFQRLKRD